jgi:diaminopimelate epimerase
MVLEFTKMNGAGNDFVLVDNRAGKITLTTEQIIRLCDRHRGIGADGLLMLVPNTHGQSGLGVGVLQQRRFSVADMCGNGARCFARFVPDTWRCIGDKTSFETAAGVISATFQWRARDHQPHHAEGSCVSARLSLSAGAKLTVHSLNTGVPHAVHLRAGCRQGDGPATRSGDPLRHDHFKSARART